VQRVPIIPEVFVEERRRYFFENKGAEMTEKDLFFLLDARGAYSKDATVLLIGTKEEICNTANSGEYGPDCIVSDENLDPMWEWFCTDFKWRWTGNDRP